MPTRTSSRTSSGRGWQLEQLSVAMSEPRYVLLVAYADAWSPSTSSVLSGRAVYVGDKTAVRPARPPPRAASSAAR